MLYGPKKSKGPYMDQVPRIGISIFQQSSVQAMPQSTVANPSPLSFTPTSVMRKTAAERKDSDPRIHVPELKVVL